VAAPSEKVLIRAHPSRLYSLGYYVAAGFLFLVSAGLLLNTYVGWFSLPVISAGPLTLGTMLTVIGAMLGLILALVAEIRRIATTYTLTDFRVVRRQGILNILTNAVPFRQIERIELDQSLIQRIVGVGTVRVDTGEDMLMIEQVREPGVFESTISQRIATFR